MPFSFVERKAKEAQERIDARHTRTSAIRAMEKQAPGTITAIAALANAFADKDANGKPRLKILSIEVHGEVIWKTNRPEEPPADDYYKGKLRPCRNIETKRRW